MELRKTKIVTTLGPASESPEVLEKMIQAGVDVVRMNFSHGSQADHEKRMQTVRSLAEKHNRYIAILADIQGPKIRVARFKNGPVTLNDGQLFTLNASLDKEAGDNTQVGLDYKELPNDVRKGDTLLLDDGKLVFEVQSIEGSCVLCEVKVGGVLSNNKGINKQGGGLTAKMLTEKDKIDLEFAVKHGADYLAVSFPRSAADIREAKALIAHHGGKAGVIAKIERTEAVEAIDEIIMASDGVMVARGDLCVEIGDAALPGVQKLIIKRAIALDKPVITATQMMESMIENSIPTRAEVLDVANAVLDGTDAVMLSAESAQGKHPPLVVEAMDRICKGSEKYMPEQVLRDKLETSCSSTDRAIAKATMFTADHMEGVKAIISLTESGSTPLWMSRIRSGISIYGLTRHQDSLRRMALYRNVFPVFFDVTRYTADNVTHGAIETLRSLGYISNGDIVILTRGDMMGVHGGTNSMKIVTVGESKSSSF